MDRNPDRIDIHGRQHRFDLAPRNLKWDSSVCRANKAHIERFISFYWANNLSVERQLIYLQKLTMLGRLHGRSFEQATKDRIVALTNK